MYTLPQLVRAHIDRLSALHSDPLAFNHATEVIKRRIAERLQQEPSISIFTLSYAQGLRDALLVIPPGLQVSVIQSCLTEALIGWEDINIAFNKSLAPKE
jgi:hypothetical protein